MVQPPLIPSPSSFSSQHYFFIPYHLFLSPRSFHPSTILSITSLGPFPFIPNFSFPLFRSLFKCIILNQIKY